MLQVLATASIDLSINNGGGSSYPSQPVWTSIVVPRPIVVLGAALRSTAALNLGQPAFVSVIYGAVALNSSAYANFELQSSSTPIYAAQMQDAVATPLTDTPSVYAYVVINNSSPGVSGNVYVDILGYFSP